MKLANHFQTLAIAKDMKGTIDEVFRYNLSPNSGMRKISKHYYWTICREKENENDRDNRGFYGETNARTKITEKDQSNCHHEIILWGLIRLHVPLYATNS